MSMTAPKSVISTPDASTHAAVAVDQAREAFKAWSQVGIGERVRRLGVMRRLISADSQAIAHRLTLANPQRACVAETLTAEVLPVLDALRFLQRRARRLLAPTTLGLRGRPLWMWGMQSNVIREPLGVVLIIAPFNYPFMLPGVAALQALAAGNSVVIKPGRNGREAALVLQEVAHQAGIPDDSLIVLDESVASARSAIGARPDHVVFTGSAENGRDVAKAAAEQGISVIMELSGCDAVFVDASADVEQVAAALTFGVSLNSGATCIAPRRVLVHASVASQLLNRLKSKFESAPLLSAEGTAGDRMLTLINDAEQDGARVVTGSRTADGCVKPYLVAQAHAGMALLQSDVFAPVLSVVSVENMDAAIAMDARCPYALGASVFGDRKIAMQLVSRIRAGSICINDLIVPTVDPRLPFSGTGKSGYGVTRGCEGLLAMTRPKAVTINRGRFRPQYDLHNRPSASMIEAAIQACHGPQRLRRLLDLVGHIFRWRKQQEQHKNDHA